MSKKRKFHPIIVITVLFLIIGVIMAIAATSCKTAPERETGIRDGILHKFVKFDDNKYGYEYNEPVTYNSSTDEKIRIPGEIVPAKRQFRAIWVATVFSMNFPQVSSQDEYQKEYSKILDSFTDWNMNAMIFQVSPLLDAFWPSEHRPWSQYVLGTTGIARQGTDPGWDPLEWMIAETHKRGLEYHAWFNPYRVTASAYTDRTIPGKEAVDLDAMSNAEVIHALRDAGILNENNFAVLNPEFVYRYERRFYLDAGIPSVNKHVFDVINEVVTKYDVDAIHFDDYFYPYSTDDRRMAVVEAVNAHLYPEYPETREAREQWRRDNNTALIEGVKAVIDAENKNSNRTIQFGVSPFGIWYRNPPDPRGSATGAATAFTYTNGVYADTWKWVKEEMIDYIVPQLYWSFDHFDAPYGELVRWWASVAEGTKVDLYIGHANYKHITRGEVEPAWMNPDEVIHQLRFNQLYPRVGGSVFFNYNSLQPSTETGAHHKASTDSAGILKEHYQKYHTLIPAKPWLKESAPAAPINVTKRGVNHISWDDAEDSDSRYYVVYRVLTANARGDISKIIDNPYNIAARVWRDGRGGAFTDSVRNAKRYTYFVTAVNGAHMESEPVVAVLKLR